MTFAIRLALLLGFAVAFHSAMKFYEDHVWL